MATLVIQIPCFNEEASLRETLEALPREVTGFERVRVLVIDDGSEDRTAEIAREWGVDQVLCLPDHEGLARAFQRGLQESLRLGADVIVNTDGDNQYDIADLDALVAPILRDEADLVVGARVFADMPWMPWWKRGLQRLGTRVVCAFGRVRVRDATSGFRALSRATAERTRVLSRYTYTLETLMQAGLTGLRVTESPVGSRPVRRPSRLIRSTPEYLWRSAGTILTTWFRYRKGHSDPEPPPSRESAQ